ncbi:hypothetical protein KIN20_031289 [Parelaphostrongylus tenuis]|uniref:Uncharacterized protein n=1 Tax=Parelaphostrongylus tenuis TaxID=148309 RepID=A0AAD5WHH9_PARTN|nr:hypothetical protein KIN20_031289 [Parelaphostrongylus tenuis]
MASPLQNFSGSSLLSVADRPSNVSPNVRIEPSLMRAALLEKLNSARNSEETRQGSEFGSNKEIPFYAANELNEVYALRVLMRYGDTQRAVR